MEYVTEIGKEYGRLAILRELRNKKKRGHYWVRCYCGHIFEATKDELLKTDCRCAFCSRKNAKSYNTSMAGESLTNYFERSKKQNKNKTWRASTAYCNVNNKNGLTKSLSNPFKSKDKRASFDGYHFKVVGNYAIGKISTGTKFIIDASSINVVNTLRLYLDSKGYLAYLNSDGKKRFLHRLLMGLESGDAYIADHINRNKLDCRLTNLRVVTAQQNAMNKSLSRKRQACYMGVFYSKTSKVFISEISLCNNRVTLLKSKNPEECAAAYNHASLILFKQFRGHINNVPEASPELKKEVEIKCHHLIQLSEILTSPVVLDKRKQEVS